ncbi:MAG: hypothetical protein PF795_04570 [Kiritimatiellae bacterium]|nr:hypothetical protein [Kiritimatiellia bacterium]
METVLQLSNFGKGVLLLSITLPLILAVAMATGAYPLSVPRVASIFWGELSGRTLVSYSALDANVLLQIRAPRVLFGSMVGAALALG